MNEKKVVLIATYNEKDNIVRLVNKILALPEQFHVLIVDDNSPDGTSGLVKKHFGNNKRVRLITRMHDKGYGKSMLHGFHDALSKKYDYILTLDADLSHDPADLPKLFHVLQKADLVVGSRYYKGIRILNWDPGRLMISIYGNKYIKTILGMPYKDMTSGYRGYRAGLLQEILRRPVRTKGYAFLVEILYRAHCKKSRIVEVPITYTDRKQGESKMTKGILAESMISPLRMRVFSLFKR